MKSYRPPRSRGPPEALPLTLRMAARSHDMLPNTMSPLTELKLHDRALRFCALTSPLTLPTVTSLAAVQPEIDVTGHGAHG